MLKYRYSPEALRVAYTLYIDGRFPENSIKSRRTKVDDVFAMFSWTSEKEAWELLTTDSSRFDWLRSVIAEEFLSHRRYPLKDAAGYVRAIKEFQRFLTLLEAIENARILLPRKVKDSK